MPFIKRNFVLSVIFLSISILFFFSNTSWASEGGSAAPAEGSASGSGSQADREWAKRTSKLNVLEAKMKEQKKHIQNMIALKKGGHGHAPAGGEGGAAAAHVDPLDEIAKTYDEFKKTNSEYSKEADELRFRYPEEGSVIERRYVPFRNQSLEQIEKEMGLDGELTRLKFKIDQKYASMVGEKEANTTIPQADKGPESTVKDIKKHGAPEEKKPTRIKLTK